MQVLCDAVKCKRECKTLTTLFLVLDYIIYFRDNGASGEYPGKSMSWSVKVAAEPAAKSPVRPAEEYEIVDNELFLFTKASDGPQILDAIQAIAMYILLTFDWDAVRDSLKDYAKEMPYYTEKDRTEEKKTLDHERIMKYRYGHDLMAYVMRAAQKSFGGSASTAP